MLRPANNQARLVHPWAILFVLLLAFGLHIAVLRELEARSPFFYHFPPGVDQHDYLRQAQGFVVGAWPGQTGFNLSPYYSFYLGILYKLLGYSLVLPRIIQILEGVLTCALVYKIGQFTFDFKTGLWAAFFLASYGPFIFYNTELMTVAHSALWISLALFGAILVSKKAKWIYYVLVGTATGLAALGQPHVLVILVGIGLWVSLLKTPLPAKIVGIVLMFGVAGAILLIPTWHNFQVEHRLKFVTTTGDYNLYIGNNPQATGVYQKVPAELLQRVDSGQTTYLAEVGRFVLNQPLSWLGLMGRKTILYLVGSDLELGSNENFYFWGEQFSYVLSLLPLRYELISLLSLLGVRYVWQQRAMLLFLCYGIYMLGTILFFVQARFRMPLVPILILISTAAVFEFYRRYRAGDKAILVVVVGLVLALGALLIRYYYLLNGGLVIVS
jgi:4-amino-4-deoxy-L-arabinose transferase-like glycosyltransferase